MKLLFVGDFRIASGGGYATILENLCQELAELGHDVTLMGIGWERGEHAYSFRVIPSDFSWIPVQVLRLHQALKFDHVILAMDIPKLMSVGNEIGKQGIQDWPVCSALFPVESTPILFTWQQTLERFHQLFVISEFGRDALDDLGIASTFIPVTARTWTPEMKKVAALRQLTRVVSWGRCALLEDPARPVVVTVADNQERKDLPIIGDAIAQLRDKHDILLTWILVTVLEAPYGWNLPALWKELWINDQVVMCQGLTKEELGWVYRAADAFILASQAEGACLPLYEAMAYGVPCVGPEHTAVIEALQGRGYLVTPDTITIHPWGNVNRYHTHPETLSSTMVKMLQADNTALIEAGKTFIDNRSWKGAAIQLLEGLDAKEDESVETVEAAPQERGPGALRRVAVAT